MVNGREPGKVYQMNFNDKFDSPTDETNKQTIHDPRLRFRGREPSQQSKVDAPAAEAQAQTQAEQVNKWKS